MPVDLNDAKFWKNQGVTRCLCCKWLDKKWWQASCEPGQGKSKSRISWRNKFNCNYNQIIRHAQFAAVIGRETFSRIAALLYNLDIIKHPDEVILTVNYNYLYPPILQVRVSWSCGHGCLFCATIIMAVLLVSLYSTYVWRCYIFAHAYFSMKSLLLRRFFRVGTTASCSFDILWIISFHLVELTVICNWDT